MNAVDLFAGMGGWDVACRELGIDDVLGVEVDDAACATREAAGLRTLRADVAALDPADFEPAAGLIASPPCQAWSVAGKRAGERDRRHVVACALEVAAGDDTRAEHRARCEDARSMLVVEPLRWTLALRPAWVAVEQVPPVLELWALFARLLEAVGYRTWRGVLSAERFGVPQTRRRAILMASLDGPVVPPAPTHQEYVPGVRARGEQTLEGELLPWVSMAEALGRGCSWKLRSNTRANASERPADEPAPTITAGHDHNEREWVPAALDRRQTGGDGTPVGLRSVDEPAPTMQAAGLAKGRDVWMAKAEDRAERKAQGAGNRPRPAEAPAATIDTRTDLATWVGERPVRVSLAEALVLQGFDPGYPVQGSRRQRFQQVGNAIPPPLAQAVLGRLAAAQSEAHDPGRMLSRDRCI